MPISAAAASAAASDHPFERSNPATLKRRFTQVNYFESNSESESESESEPEYEAEVNYYESESEFG